MGVQQPRYAIFAFSAVAFSSGAAANALTAGAAAQEVLQGPTGCFFNGWRFHPAMEGVGPVRNVASPLACQKKCQEKPGCKVFGYVPKHSSCWFGTNESSLLRDKHFVSGPLDCKDTSLCSAMPGADFPGETPEASRKAWPATSSGDHLVPPNLQCWPRNELDGSLAHCPGDRATVLEDTVDGWPGKCEGLLKVILPQDKSCRESCEESVTCSGWEIRNEGGVGYDSCYQGAGYDCWDPYQPTVVVSAQRLMRGSYRVLKDLKGFEIDNLKYAFNAAVFGSDMAKAVLACNHTCLSLLKCEYWQFSTQDGCWFNDPAFKEVPYPLTLASLRHSTAAANSVVAGEYIQRFCSGSETDAATTLVKGSNVKLIGLDQAPSLNGKEGVLDEWDSTIGEWVVALDGGAVKQAVKSENIQVLTATELSDAVSSETSSLAPTTPGPLTVLAAAPVVAAAAASGDLPSGFTDTTEVVTTSSLATLPPVATLLPLATVAPPSPAPVAAIVAPPSPAPVAAIVVVEPPSTSIAALPTTGTWAPAVTKPPVNLVVVPVANPVPPGAANASVAPLVTPAPTPATTSLGPTERPPKFDAFLRDPDSDAVYFRDEETNRKHLLRFSCDSCHTPLCGNVIVVSTVYLDAVEVGQDFACDMLVPGPATKGLVVFTTEQPPTTTTAFPTVFLAASTSTTTTEAPGLMEEMGGVLPPWMWFALCTLPCCACAGIFVALQLGHGKKGKSTRKFSLCATSDDESPKSDKGRPLAHPGYDSYSQVPLPQHASPQGTSPAMGNAATMPTYTGMGGMQQPMGGAREAQFYGQPPQQLSPQPHRQQLLEVSPEPTQEMDLITVTDQGLEVTPLRGTPPPAGIPVVQPNYSQASFSPQSPQNQQQHQQQYQQQSPQQQVPSYGGYSAQGQPRM